MARLIILVIVALVASFPSAADAKKRHGKKASAAASAKAEGKSGKTKKSAAKPIAVVSPQPTPKDGPVRTAIGKILKQHKLKTKVLSGKRAEKAFPKGEPTPSNSGWARIAHQLKVDGFVEFSITKVGGKSQADVFVRSGADGSVLGQETFSAKGPPKKLARELSDSFWDKLGSAVEQLASGESAGGGLPPRDLGEEKAEPSKPEPQEKETPEPSPPREKAKPVEPVAEAEKEEKEEKEEREEKRAEAKSKKKADEEEAEEEEEREKPAGGTASELAAVDIELDLRFLRRLWEYNPLSAASRYFLSFYTPVLGGRASWFPLRNLGVFLGGEQSIGMTSVGFPTTDQELQVGAQFRLPLSFGQIGASAGYFQHYFLITDSTVAGARSMLQVPNTVYRGGRLAGSARFHFAERFQVGVEVAYRLVTTAGEDTAQVKSPQYFPNSAAPVAVDANAFLGARLTSFGGWLLDARAGVDYRRYAFGRLQTTQTAVVQIDAGGALDEYLVFYFGLAGVWGGK